MAIDTNAASGGNSLIPEGTIVACKVTLKPGYGTRVPDGTPSKAGSTVHASYELEVSHPTEHKGRKMWLRPGLVDKEGKMLSEGGNYYVQQGAYELRAMVESARNIAHDDMSAAAIAARQIELNDLHGATILVTVKHEADNKGVDRSVVDGILTPSDYPEYVDARNRFGLSPNDLPPDIH